MIYPKIRNPITATKEGICRKMGDRSSISLDRHLHTPPNSLFFKETSRWYRDPDGHAKMVRIEIYSPTSGDYITADLATNLIGYYATLFELELKSKTGEKVLGVAEVYEQLEIATKALHQRLFETQSTEL